MDVAIEWLMNETLGSSCISNNQEIAWTDYKKKFA